VIHVRMECWLVVVKFESGLLAQNLKSKMPNNRGNDGNREILHRDNV